jgi:hypothetical protein
MNSRLIALATAGALMLVVPKAQAQGDEESTSDSTAETRVAPNDDHPSAVSARAIALPGEELPPPTLTNSWLARPPLTITAGAGAGWHLTIYGFAEADFMRDSTRSFNDGLNSNVVAHIQTQAGDNARAQSSIRNSRIGVQAQAPTFNGIRSSGVLEFDLFGNQPNINGGGGSPAQPSGPGATTEAAYFNNAGLRVRHAYMKLESAVIDVLVGQTYHLLGWQNYFFGASCGFLGLPNALFNRTVQLRLGHTFATDAVNLDLAVAALRPAERDSALPEAEGGLRLTVNHWKGMTTPGSGGTGALPAALAVSGLFRSLSVDPYAPLPAPPVPLTGWAVAANALIPIIPVKDGTDRGNALTVTGEFVTGTADADQYSGMTAGATMPNAYQFPPDTPVMVGGTAAPAPGLGGVQPLVGLPYTPHVDPGLVAFDPHGRLHTINWQTFIVGLQYYLPPTGRVFVTTNYSQALSNNIASLFHPGATTQLWVNSKAVFSSSRYIDGNLFVDITPAARVGVSYQRVQQVLADGTNARNDRYEMTWLYFF